MIEGVLRLSARGAAALARHNLGKLSRGGLRLAHHQGNAARSHKTEREIDLMFIIGSLPNEVLTQLSEILGFSHYMENVQGLLHCRGK